MLHHCYRNRCTLVTENDASLLLILMYSILPKMMYFSLPITTNTVNISGHPDGDFVGDFRIRFPYLLLKIL